MVKVHEARKVRSRELAEVLAQQAATSEILRVISRSYADVQPVFETIVRNAVTLCNSLFANVFRYNDGLLHYVASCNTGPSYVELLQAKYPMRPDSSQVSGRVILSRSVVRLEDARADSHYDQRFPTAMGWRRMLGVPMLHEGKPLGVIVVGWAEAGPVPRALEELLQTFADQAVIAIENARLFDELQARNRDMTEALEQQTATGEILHAISRSPTDVQPVFDTIAKAAMKLCGATSANVFTFDGKLLHAAAIHVINPGGEEAFRRIFPRPADRGTAASRAVLARDVVVIPDTLTDPDYTLERPSHWGYRSALGVPLIRDGVPIGALALGRSEPGPFPEKQIALLRTFADQAVIAIENVRLFKELEVGNRELTEALKQQTATSEILHVISRSPSDVQPVFDTICAAVVKLCRASAANVFTYDGRLLHGAATSVVNPEGREDILRFYPRPADRGTVSGRAILARGVVVIEDVLLDQDYEHFSIAKYGFRSVLGVPLMREGKPVGAIAVGRPVSGAFPETQVALLQMFADQAVIALENVRLIGELETQTKQLALSVDQLRALAEVSQAVSSTLDLETVLSTIVSRATELAGMDGGVIYEYEESRELFHLRATDGLPAELFEALRSTSIPKGEGAIGRLATDGEPVVISDILGEGMYQSRVREILVRYGYRSLVAVPLLREHGLLGGLVVNRKSAGGFEPHVTDLLQTFAAQSALAIQNARLFHEIEDKTRQLEIASRHKSAFLAHMSHELRTPLNAIIGFTRIVMRRTRDQLEAKQYENLEKILTSGHNLLSLINAILDLAKVEAGHVEITAREIQLAPVLEQCMRTVEPLVKEGVILVKGFDGALPQMLVDDEKLRQI